MDRIQFPKAEAIRKQFIITHIDALYLKFDIRIWKIVL